MFEYNIFKLAFLFFVSLTPFGCVRMLVELEEQEQHFVVSRTQVTIKE